MRRLCRSALTVALLAAVHAPSQAQTSALADAARLAEQQRRAGNVAARVYTNRELLAPAGSPSAQSSGAVNSAAGSTTTSAARPASIAAAASAAAAQVVPENDTASKAPTAKSKRTSQLTSAAPAAGTVASPRPWGRVAFFANAATLTPAQGESRSYAEYVTQVAIRSAEESPQGIEYGLDTRMAGYSGLERDSRVSIYDAWTGVKLMDGALRVRGGQMWVTELGGLGAIAGGMVEYRRPLASGTLRLAGFGGLEPETYQAGYVRDVKRYGGYAAFDAGALRRHVVGYVMVRDATLTERSVLSSTNYVPIGKRVFVYQALEYDLTGPGGQGDGGLTYFFVNGRGAATKRIDLQGSYHRGRSVDARSITLDQLNGRPISPKTLEGLLFESASGRVTVEVVRGVRAYAGFGRDKNNRDSDLTNRFTLGGSASNVAKSGIDATVAMSRIDRGVGGSFDSWYMSVGRNVGRRLYLTGEYSSSLSVLRFAGADGFIVEQRPETHRFGVTSIVNLGRSWSVLATVERTTEQDANELRVLSGLTYRLP